MVMFRRLLAEKTADPATRISRLQQAVGLYTADFMAGFNVPDSPEFDDWQFFMQLKLASYLDFCSLNSSVLRIRIY